MNIKKQKQIYRKIAVLQFKHDSNAVNENGQKLSFLDIESVRVKYNITEKEVFDIIFEGSKADNWKTWGIPDYE
mgnify:CR=1 FL=1